MSWGALTDHSWTGESATVATESAAERALNPGLPAHAVDTIVAACCIVVALMRHLHLDQIDVRTLP